MMARLPCGTLYCYKHSKAVWLFFSGKRCFNIREDKGDPWNVGEDFYPPGPHVQVLPEEWQE